MIKPLNSASSLAFKGSLEEYQQQIKNKVNPKYNLVLTPGSDAPKPSVKRGLAGIFKGYNNITEVVKGTAKGLVSGAAIGALTGAVIKNFKENSSTIVTETGKKIHNVQFGKFIGDTVKDIINCGKSALKRIGEVTQKPLIEVPKEFIKDIVGLPGKYMKYLGRGNKLAKVAAIGVGLGVLGYNIVKAKVQANRKNADVDHSLNLKH